MKPFVLSAAITMLLAGAGLDPAAAKAQAPTRTQPSIPLEALKQEVIAGVKRQGTLVQQTIDHLSSYGELGFHETETSRILPESSERMASR